jgi:hypothetical protein
MKLSESQKIVTDQAKWLLDDDIRPYVYMREENRIRNPGIRNVCSWFPHQLQFKNAMLMDSVEFGNQILKLEAQAFRQSSMEMPRWVFYDCAIMPGFVCGFVKRTSSLPESFKSALNVHPSLEWTPMSLFIIIPTMRPGEWVAHNLCTVNSLVSADENYYGLGFLTKAYGLWHANVEVLCGFTQWSSPARKLHSHYGQFEILSAYTPQHTHAMTMTYRSRVDSKQWATFFDDSLAVDSKLLPTDHLIHPDSETKLKEFQKRLESGDGPFYLDPVEVRNQPLDGPLRVYRLANGQSGL